MGDRRPSFLRFLSGAPTSRRTSATRTTAPPPAKTTTLPSSTTSSAAETGSSGKASTTPTPTTPSTAETQLAGREASPSSRTPTPATPVETQSAGKETPPSKIPSGAETQSGRKETTPSSPTPSTAVTTSGGQTTATNHRLTTPPTADSRTDVQETTPFPTINNLTKPRPEETLTPPSSEAQMADQSANTLIGLTKESQTSSPSQASLQSRVSSQPASPPRATTKSQSPPQSSSPSRAATQSRATPSSQSSRLGSQVPLTSQRTSKPHSPSRAAPRPTKQASSPSAKGASTPKERHHTTTEISHPLSSSYEASDSIPNKEAPKPAASGQERIDLQPQAKFKSNSFDDYHNQTSLEKRVSTIQSPAQGQETLEATQKLDSSSIHGETKLLMKSNGKPEENKEVKEVIQDTKFEANEKRNNEGSFLAAKSGSRAQMLEEVSTVNKSEKRHEETREAINRKEIPTSLFNVKPTNTISNPGNKSMNVPMHKLSAKSSREQVPLHKEIRDDISTFVNRMAIGDPKSSINDRPVSVITLAGENRGVSMYLGSDSSKEGAVHIYRGYKSNPDESPEAVTDGERSSKGEISEGIEDQPTEAYVNNNTQGINNSIVFNSSMTERDPGVHVTVTCSLKEPPKLTEEKRHPQLQKSEFNMIPAKKLTYEPNVRKRCLRGFLLESSDPEKPKHHGCRVGCNEKSKHNTVDVV